MVAGWNELELKLAPLSASLPVAFGPLAGFMDAWGMLLIIATGAIAAVAATSPHIADEALALIQVEYEELPPVLNAADAMKDGAPLLHERSGLERFGFAFLRVHIHRETQRRRAAGDRVHAPAAVVPGRAGAVDGGFRVAVGRCR